MSEASLTTAIALMALADFAGPLAVVMNILSLCLGLFQLPRRMSKQICILCSCSGMWQGHRPIAVEHFTIVQLRSHQKVDRWWPGKAMLPWRLSPPPPPPPPHPPCQLTCVLVSLCRWWRGKVRQLQSGHFLYCKCIRDVFRRLERQCQNAMAFALIWPEAHRS